MRGQMPTFKLGISFDNWGEKDKNIFTLSARLDKAAF